MSDDVPTSGSRDTVHRGGSRDQDAGRARRRKPGRRLRSAALDRQSPEQADAVAGAHRSVSFLELFFDLVWVFAVSQLSGYLVDDLSWRGAAQTAVLGLAMTVCALVVIAAALSYGRAASAASGQ